MKNNCLSFLAKSALSKKGSLTVQFLLAFILCISFVFFFAVISLTLATASITQYITYASARQLFLGHADKEAQDFVAKEKYRGLRNDTFPGLFNVTGGSSSVLFAVASDLTTNGSCVANDQSAEGMLGSRGNLTSQNTANHFYGVCTGFEPKIFKLNLPFGGQTTSFQTTIGSYLGREPSQRECTDFNNHLIQAIVNNPDIRHSIQDSDITDAFSIGRLPEFDNGC